MKRNLRILCLLLSILVIASLASCKEEEKKEEIAIALIPTEKGVLNDQSFNQGTREGIEKYINEKGLSYKAYEPLAKTEQQFLKQIEAAVNDGAQIIVTPGFNFESSILIAQDKYPRTKFILLDGIPNNGKFDDTRVEKVSKNTYSIFYAEEQAGFLAGYSAVKDGFKNLGFLGGKAFPSVIRFGYGFIQGAEFAGKELGLGKDELEIKYGYCGNFVQSAENQAQAAAWYEEGTEVIFACGGAIGLSVMAAAEGYENKWVIGVDVDQSFLSKTVITSSLKMLSNSVYQAISAYYDGEFPGGKNVFLGANENGIGLSIETSKFRTFSKNDYNTIYKMLADNKDGVTDGIVKNTDITPTDIETKCVKVIVKTLNNL